MAFGDRDPSAVFNPISADSYERQRRLEDELRMKYGSPTASHYIAEAVKHLVAVVDNGFVNLAQSHDRLARVITSMIEQQQQVTEQLTTALRIAEIRADHWEREAHRLAAQAGVPVETTSRNE